MSRVTVGDNGITLKYSVSKHRGVDIGWHNKESDNKIKAHSTGKVVGLVTNYNKTDTTGSSYGNYILLEHKKGYKTRYAHLKYGSIKVKLNSVVNEGDIIATMGNTGRSSGRHLHFEVIKNGVRIDPTEYLYRDLPEQEETTGLYKILKNKYIRLTPEVKDNNKVKYDNLMYYMKEKCIKDIKGYAKLKIGSKVNITSFKKDIKGNTWGRLETINTPLYVCIYDSTGSQAIKI